MIQHSIRLYGQRGVGAAGLGLALAFALANAPWPGTRADAQQAEKTVEQTHKNIQVLTGMPDSQLRPVMGLFNAALGVGCAGCHERKGEQMDFASDGNEHKNIARRMIKMTQEINKANFGGRPQVTCYTCHQGHEHPVGVPNFPLPAATPAAANNTAPAARPAAPKPEEIIAKYVQAVGGKEAAEKVKSRTLTGTYQTARGMTLHWTLNYQAPDKLSSVLTSPQGESVTVLNGATGWVKDQRGQREMSALERAAAQDLIELLDVIKLREPYSQLAFGGRAKVRDRDAVVLRTTRDGKRIRYFFDAETGLLLRRIAVTDTPVGGAPDQTDYEDYRDVDGVKLPMTIRSQNVDAFYAGTRKLTEVKHNTAIDPALFAAPAKP